MLPGRLFLSRSRPQWPGWLPVDPGAEREDLSLHVVEVGTDLAGLEVEVTLMARAIEVGGKELHTGHENIGGARRDTGFTTLAFQRGRREVTGALVVEVACAKAEMFDGVLPAGHPTQSVRAARGLRLELAIHAAEFGVAADREAGIAQLKAKASDIHVFVGLAVRRIAVIDMTSGEVAGGGIEAEGPHHRLVAAAYLERIAADVHRCRLGDHRGAVILGDVVRLEAGAEAEAAEVRRDVVNLVRRAFVVRPGKGIDRRCRLADEPVLDVTVPAAVIEREIVTLEAPAIVEVERAFLLTEAEDISQL